MTPRDTRNPIFEFAANGQCAEGKGQWHQAVEWYHKTLACLPNFYGADKPIKSFQSNGLKTVRFTKRHAARIYVALSRVLMKLGRIEDSLMASMAAHRLDATNTLAGQFLSAASGALQKSGGQTAMSIGKNDVLSDGSIALKDYLTIIVVTHCTGRLKKFRALSPPSTKLLTATYGSLLAVFGEEIGQCSKLLCYDYNPDGSDRETIYFEALKSFSRQHGFDLHVYESAGLFATLYGSIRSVATPYIFFVEHDWLFRGGPIQLGAIIGDMNADPDMHSVRFNKRENQLDGHDFIMEVDTRKSLCPFLRTASHSNNPSVIRTSKLKNEWLPLCRQALRRVAGDLRGSAFGIEEILFKRHAADIRQIGFHGAHSCWGTYVYGKVGDPPRIVHLGE